MSIRAIRSDTEHLPCVVEVIGADIYNLTLTGDKACTLTEGVTSTGTCPKVLILDHHPNDSRTDIAEDQQAIQTLTSRMGTGGADLTWQGCSGLTQTATTLDTAARTLSKSQPKTCAVVCYAEKRFFEWHEDDKSVNIRASSGSYGGGSEVLVCTKEQIERTKCGQTGMERRPLQH